MDLERPVEVSSTSADRPPSSETLNKRTDPYQFGTRYLTDEDDVFAFNAWDHVEEDDSFRDYAEKRYALQRQTPVSDFDKSESCTTSNFSRNRCYLCDDYPIMHSSSDCT